MKWSVNGEVKDYSQEDGAGWDIWLPDGVIEKGEDKKPAEPEKKDDDKKPDVNPFFPFAPADDKPKEDPKTPEKKDDEPKKDDDKDNEPSVPETPAKPVEPVVPPKPKQDTLLEEAWYGGHDARWRIQ